MGSPGSNILVQEPTWLPDIYDLISQVTYIEREKRCVGKDIYIFSAGVFVDPEYPFTPTVIVRLRITVKSTLCTGFLKDAGNFFGMPIYDIVPLSVCISNDLKYVVVTLCPIYLHVVLQAAAKSILMIR